MDHFAYRDGNLFCEDVPVAEIARQAGTPVYIYSAATLRQHYRSLSTAFANLDATICFSVKALSNLQVLKLLAEEGCGFDILSGGELVRVLACGGEAGKVAFAGVGKNDAEISEAIEAGVGLFNVESSAEFENLSRLAAAAGKKINAGLRINPDVYDPKTHAYTITGKKETKFGVDIDRAVEFFERFGRDEHVTLETIDFHIGSPIYSPEPYVQAIRKTLDLVEDLRSRGFEIRTLDLGGGFAADYEEGKSPLVAEYALAIVPLLKDKGLKVILEMGRVIACNAGILLSRTLYTKQGGQKRFVIVDAATTDLIRPALYQAEHFIYPAELDPDAAGPQRRMDFAPPGGQMVDIVGGVCETSDVLGAGRCLPPLHRGDLVAIFSAGAYSFVMSSQYNARPRAAEVMVEGKTWRIIRRRETYDDLLAAERDL